MTKYHHQEGTKIGHPLKTTCRSSPLLAKKMHHRLMTSLASTLFTSIIFPLICCHDL